MTDFSTGSPVTDVTGVGISLVIETMYFSRWGLPLKPARWFAMTGKSMVRGWMRAASHLLKHINQTHH